jgi:hypothetical protein
MKKISNHISYKEGVNSNTATRRKLKNNPNETQLKSMVLVANSVFEPVRIHFNKRIRINSFFRCEKLNTVIGGSRTSQHCSGEAIDMDGMDGLSNSSIFHYIKDNLDFDQLIWEFGTDKEPSWVHVSFKKSGNRKQILKAVYSKPTYRLWK